MTKLRKHFTKMHFDYPDDGRVIDSEDYLRLVHDEDHADGQGIRIPHTHKANGKVRKTKERIEA